MKKITLGLLIMLTGALALAQKYTPADEGSKVQFKLKNFGFSVTGSFKGLKGAIQFDPASLGTAAFDVTVDAKTVFTDNDMRDNHLRNEDYFDVQNHPLIHFVSTKVTPSNKAGTLFMFAQLTIKNQTKDISFPFTATPTADGFVFDGEFKINRKDFEVGGTSTISNEITIILHVLTKK